MKKNMLKIAVLIVACAFTLSTQAFAGPENSEGKGKGDTTRIQDPTSDDCQADCVFDY